MDNQTLLAAVDHTLLTQTATWDEIRQICDDGAAYGCASVCIPASYVKQAADYLGDRLPVCTVIGFPNGYSTTASRAITTSSRRSSRIRAISSTVGSFWCSAIYFSLAWRIRYALSRTDRDTRIALLSRR